MKKKFIPVLCAAFCMLLASCSPALPSSETPSSETPTSSEQPSTPEEPSTPSEDPSSEEPSIPSEDSSSEEPSIPSSSEEPEKGHPFITEPTEIEIWATFNDTYGAVIKAFVERFKELEPNVTVNYQKKSGSYDDLREAILTGFPANNYPDVAICYPDHVAEYIEYNKVVKMDKYIDNADYGWTDEDKDDILPLYMEEVTSYSVPGTWSLPFAKSSEAMFYNATVLINLNLSDVDPTINGGNPLTEEYLNNLTWEELFNKLCPALVAKNEKLPADQKFLLNDQEYHGVIGYDSDDNLFITLAEQYGYPYTSLNQTTGVASVDFNNEGMKDLMKTFNAAYKNGYIVTKASCNNSYVNNLFTKKNLLFSIGSTGGTMYQYADDLFTVGVAPIPHAEEGESAVINQGPGLVTFKHNDANRELASWLFYKFITETENTTYWAMQTSYLPIRYSAFESEMYAEYSDITDKEGEELLTAKVAQLSVELTPDLYYSPAFKGSATCRTQAGSVMAQCLVEKDLTQDKLDKIFLTAYEQCILAL